jgi:hypothetical protein
MQSLNLENFLRRETSYTHGWTSDKPDDRFIINPSFSNLTVDEHETSLTPAQTRSKICVDAEPWQPVKGCRKPKMWWLCQYIQAATSRPRPRQWRQKLGARAMIDAPENLDVCLQSASIEPRQQPSRTTSMLPPRRRKDFFRCCVMHLTYGGGLQCLTTDWLVHY